MKADKSKHNKKIASYAFESIMYIFGICLIVFIAVVFSAMAGFGMFAFKILNDSSFLESILSALMFSPVVFLFMFFGITVLKSFADEYDRTNKELEKIKNEKHR